MVYTPPRRCFDCLDDFAPTSSRYGVLKQMRDMPPDVDPIYDVVEVCEDCSGWYDDACLID